MKGPIGFELSPLAEKASQIIQDLSSIDPNTLRHWQEQLLQIIECMDVEIASRGSSIQTMNEIIRYNNSDGHSSVPGPHEIAKRYVEAADALARFAATGQGITFSVIAEGDRQRALDLYRGIHVPPGIPV